MGYDSSISWPGLSRWVGEVNTSDEVIDKVSREAGDELRQLALIAN
jgi:hypothetical protein